MPLIQINHFLAPKNEIGFHGKHVKLLTYFSTICLKMKVKERSNPTIYISLILSKTSDQRMEVFFLHQNSAQDNNSTCFFIIPKNCYLFLFELNCGFQSKVNITQLIQAYSKQVPSNRVYINIYKDTTFIIIYSEYLKR